MDNSFWLGLLSLSISLHYFDISFQIYFLKTTFTGDCVESHIHAPHFFLPFNCAVYTMVLTSHVGLCHGPALGLNTVRRRDSRIYMISEIEHWLVHVFGYALHPLSLLLGAVDLSKKENTCEQLVSLYPHRTIIDLLSGSRTNGYKLAHDGFSQGLPSLPKEL